MYFDYTDYNNMDKKSSFNHFLIISLVLHLGIGCGIAGWLIPYMKNFNPGVDERQVILLEIGWKERESKVSSVENEAVEKKKVKRQLMLVKSSVSNEVRIEEAKKTVEPAKKMIEKSSPDSIQRNGLSGKDKMSLLSGNNPYLEEVRRRIERAKFYPPRAKMARVEGKVALEFQIDKFGRAQNVNLAQPSKHKILNMAARNILDKASPFPKPKDKLIIDKTIETTLVFELVY